MCRVMPKGWAIPKITGQKVWGWGLVIFLGKPKSKEVTRCKMKCIFPFKDMITRWYPLDIMVTNFFLKVMQAFKKVKRPSMPAFFFLKCSLSPDNILVNIRHPPFSLPQNAKCFMRYIYRKWIWQRGEEGESESWKIPTNHSKCLPKLWMILLLISTFLNFSSIYFLISGSTKEASLASGRSKSKVKSYTEGSRTSGRFS